MKQKTFTLILLLSMFLCGTHAWALDEPVIPATTLTDGGTYVMMNSQSPKWYMTRTSWDGAIYLTTDEVAYKSIAFTAHMVDVSTVSDSIKEIAKNASGVDYTGTLWYFTIKDSVYVGNNDATGNLINTNYISTPYYWIVKDGAAANYYDIRSFTRYQSLDLNAGAQYFVLFDDENADRAYAQNKWAFLSLDAQANYIAKWGLYNEINTATEKNTTSDPTLTAAIATATTVYNNAQATTEDLTTAIANLKTAVAVYEQSKGDITNKLVNPSFEDLSSQNNATTTSVANPPAGWNIIVNGTACATADEIKAAGLTGWCGVNADIDATKDGSYGFGIWNQNIPEFEISQTITGLDRGTYTVSCGLMGSSNSSGSRLTTQRVFANNNSTYFGHPTDYSASNLASDEISTYGEYDETMNDQGPLQTCSTKVYVYDGTLKVGIRTNGVSSDGSQNGGGRGWFKADNFKVVNNGYSASDAMNTLKSYISIGETLVDGYMEEKLCDNFLNLISDATDYTKSSTTTPEGIDNMIIKLTSNISVVKKTVSAYKDFSVALQDANNNLTTYNSLSGIFTYSDLYGQWSDAYDSRSVNADSIAKILTQMSDALAELKRSGVKANTDITNLITNPSFETGNYNGWTLSSKSLTWCGVNTDGDAATKNGSYIFGIWNNPIPNFELSQTISGLQGGYYKVTCGLMGSANGGGSRMTTQRLFINNNVQYFGSETDYNAAALDSLFPAEKRTFAGHVEGTTDACTLEAMEATTAINTGDALKIGIRTSGDLTAVNNRAANGAGGDGWFKCDNFTLTCIALQEGAGINGTEGTIKSVAKTQIYDVNGIQRSTLRKGINILKYTMTDGSSRTSKIIVK